jgi:hypothetical protein
MGILTTMLAMPLTRFAQRYKRRRAVTASSRGPIAPATIEEAVD